MKLDGWKRDIRFALGYDSDEIEPRFSERLIASEGLTEGLPGPQYPKFCFLLVIWKEQVFGLRRVKWTHDGPRMDDALVGVPTDASVFVLPCDQDRKQVNSIMKSLTSFDVASLKPGNLYVQGNGG